MNTITASSPIRYIKGIGEKRAQLLKRMGVETAGQLVTLYPRAYEDRGVITPVDKMNQAGAVYNLLLTVGEIPRGARISGGRQMVSFRAYDETGVVKIVFFNQLHLKDAFEVGDTYRFRGKVSVSGNTFTMTSPSFEKADDPSSLPDIVPVYPLTAGLNGKALAGAIQNALKSLTFKEFLPPSVIRENSLCSLDFAMRNIHQPQNAQALKQAQKRLSFDEFFLFSLSLINMRRKNRVMNARKMPDVSLSSLLSRLPYELTDAQKEAVNDIKSDLVGAKYPDCDTIPYMRRLLQGDVGSGKTIVAACAVFMAVRSGKRAAMMVPTEILAHQHFNDMQPLFESLGIPVALLTGSTTPAQRKKLTALLKEDSKDSPRFIIGTHALLENYVQIPDLGLIITDEQHRFGVNQREKLADKNSDGVHTLIMSATPIPRTLAIFLFGDLDISVINQLPPNRQKVDTFLVDESYRTRINAFIRKQVDSGHQVYIICPLIEDENGESELKSAADYHKNLSQRIFPDLKVALLHGKMKPAQKDEVMSAFAKGEYHILVSTTVIEVGVNVPNATLMIVENAERFGLSQLHQLRGRVGRGSHKSYCVLFSQSGAERLKFMTKTNDGFEIARFDLENRGPGDFFGQRQSGELHFRFADGSDIDMLTGIKNQADRLLSADPDLSDPENTALRLKLMSTHSSAERVST
ncbi:MAG: ATP-dependent DNA helicase RecG [Ruminococcaceae bacterium]|nr:ATP-dependent DNA helicase RecG [Oscillospiraceae bacterium]